MISLNKLKEKSFRKFFENSEKKGSGLCMLVHFGQWRVLWTGYWLKQWSYLEALTVGVVNWKEGAESKNATLWDERTDLMRSTAPHCAPCGVFHTLKLCIACEAMYRQDQIDQEKSILFNSQYNRILFSLTKYPRNWLQELSSTCGKKINFREKTYLINGIHWHSLNLFFINLLWRKTLIYYVVRISDGESAWDRLKK